MPPGPRSTIPNPHTAVPGSIPITRRASPIPHLHDAAAAAIHCAGAASGLSGREMRHLLLVDIEVSRDALHVVVLLELLDHLQDLLRGMPRHLDRVLREHRDFG